MNVGHAIQAWRELWRRYRSVWCDAWQQRRQLSWPRFRADEAEFLPAALAVQAAPVSPVGRWIARIMMLFVLVLIVWSCVGTIDIVATGHGRIVPTSRTKSLAAVEVARVNALYVREGQAVKAGDTLIELDTRVIDAERQKADGERQNALLEVARARALLDALETGRTPRLAEIPEMPHDRRLDAQHHLSGQWEDFLAKRERLDTAIFRYWQSLPLATQRAVDYAALLSTRDISRHAWLEAEQKRIDIAGQLADARSQRKALLAETRRGAQDALNDALRVLGDATQDARRAQAHGELLRLTAPIDGTVQELTVHTTGTAVPAAQPLMLIVPGDGPVELEAFIENRDVGFVKEDQAAKVKIDAFEYTKYGTVPARVVHVSRDAIQDEKKGLVYSVKVALERASLNVDGRQVPLSPGMSGSVEIKTGSRRVIEYVLSPLLRHGQESLHER